MRSPRQRRPRRRPAAADVDGCGGRDEERGGDGAARGAADARQLYVRRKALFDVSTHLEQSVTALACCGPRRCGRRGGGGATRGDAEEEHEWWEEEDEVLITSVRARGTLGRGSAWRRRCARRSQLRRAHRGACAGGGGARRRRGRRRGGAPRAVRRDVGGPRRHRRRQLGPADRQVLEGLKEERRKLATAARGGAVGRGR